MIINSPESVQKIKNQLDKKSELVFELTNGVFSREYVILIQKELPNYLVYVITWKNQLIIAPSISTSLVIENKEEFYNGIKLFDQTAHELMHLMAKQFKIDLNNPNELYDLKRNRSENQRGTLNANSAENKWEYYFHGKSCSFTNVKTKQFLDVQIIP